MPGRKLHIAAPARESTCRPTGLDLRKVYEVIHRLAGNCWMSRTACGCARRRLHAAKRWVESNFVKGHRSPDMARGTPGLAGTVRRPRRDADLPDDAGAGRADDDARFAGSMAQVAPRTLRREAEARRDGGGRARRSVGRVPAFQVPETFMGIGKA